MFGLDGWRFWVELIGMVYADTGLLARHCTKNETSTSYF